MLGIHLNRAFGGRRDRSLPVLKRQLPMFWIWIDAADDWFGRLADDVGAVHAGSLSLLIQR
jgi:hypothetical protein